MIKELRVDYRKCFNNSALSSTAKRFSPTTLQAYLTGFGRMRIQFNPSTIGCFYLGHLITLSALASTFGGIVRPICLAVLRLITSSNFVGCSTGRSDGFVPFSILSTKTAAR
jgi:hypothetical protein